MGWVVPAAVVDCREATGLLREAGSLHAGSEVAGRQGTGCVPLLLQFNPIKSLSCAQVECDVGAPQVNYRESISRVADIKYTHKKQARSPAWQLHHCARLMRAVRGLEGDWPCFVACMPACAGSGCYSQLQQPRSLRKACCNNRATGRELAAERQWRPTLQSSPMWRPPPERASCHADPAPLCTLRRQSGGSGQFAEVAIRFEPGEAGTGFEFRSDIKGGTVPKEYIPGVTKVTHRSRRALPCTIPGTPARGVPLPMVMLLWREHHHKEPVTIPDERASFCRKRSVGAPCQRMQPLLPIGVRQQQDIV